MRRFTKGIVVPGAAILAASTLSAFAELGAQQVQSRQLGKAETEFADPFTQIAAVRELKDGRVLVIDTRDKIVQLVDLKTGSATKVGREGQGPGEYSLPMSIVALPGDSSAVFDPLNQRYLVIGPDGKPLGFFSSRPDNDDDSRDAAARPGGGRPFGGFSMNPPRGTDRSGNIYLSGPPMKFGPDGPVPLDSAPLQRFDRVKKSLQTVGYIKVPKGNTQVSGSAGRMNVRMGGANPFAARDDWAVAADGRIAVIHADDYHVEWIAPNGHRTAGPATPYNKTKLTNAHKAWWQENQRRRGTGLMITNNNGKMSASTAPPPSGPPEERDDWPEYLPPFLGNGAAQVAPNGQLWVLQASASDDVVPTYDIFDAAGKLTARVQLAKRSRVVGFGNNTVYVVRSDEDDLQYLQRYRLQ
ncbi:MAG TPA: hypothetical protein VGQ52_07945 [Gemmatimonadaceae bacterium]|nr:hypothetical protein [Gemmatimonadaceae bacterium]